jgi:hypothetical protein
MVERQLRVVASSDKWSGTFAGAIIRIIGMPLGIGANTCGKFLGDRDSLVAIPGDQAVQGNCPLLWFVPLSYHIPRKENMV